MTRHDWTTSPAFPKLFRHTDPMSRSLPVQLTILQAEYYESFWIVRYVNNRNETDESHCAPTRDAWAAVIFFFLCQRGQMTSGENNRPNNRIKATKTPRRPRRKRCAKGSRAQPVGRGGWFIAGDLNCQAPRRVSIFQGGDDILLKAVRNEGSH